ncbi:MAG: S9 family peptidase [Candidatus Sulfotelmatobacter sp.]
MRRFIFVAVAVIAFTFSAFAQVKHPFTFEDMMKLKRVGEPEVSPDGKWVIFSVVDVDLAANTKTPHIWIVPLTGTEEKSGVPHVSPNLRDVGTTEHVLIPGQDGDRPRWAPDGKRFAFISTKEQGSQVWVADFDGVAGRVTGVYKLTSVPTEASGELWSPDGSTILFTSDVYPECDGESDEFACNARKLEEREKSKVKALVFDHLLYRHWNAYKEGKRSHIFVVGLIAGVPPHLMVESTRDLTPGDYDAPVFSLGGQDNYAFSPDGKEICYTSNHDKNPAASTNNDLWIVPLNSGSGIGSGTGIGSGSGERGSMRLAPPPAKNITADNPASDSTPLYSPDGRYIAYRAQQRPGYESDRFRLMLYDRKTGEKRVVAKDFDRWIGTFVWARSSSPTDWAPDSYVFAVSEDKGESAIYALFPGGDLAVPLARGFNDDLAVADGGKTLIFTRMSLQHPSEIYRLSGLHECRLFPANCDAPPSTKTKYGTYGEGREQRFPLVDEAEALTSLNRAVLGQIDMQPLESFWFTGAHNDKVQGFLVKPPNFDASKRYPVKFLIHGGPQGAWGDDWSYRWNPELFASPTSSTPSGYVVIMINFHGSTGYGQKFIDAINGDWGGAPFEDLMKGLDYAEKTYPFIDKDRECALGASYGGYMINWILGHTDRFKCLVSHDGMFDAVSAWGATEELWFNDWEFKGTPYGNRAMYEKWSPSTYAKNFKTPTLVIHGQKDYRLDVSQGFELFTTLQMEGVPSEMLYFPDEGHWVQKPQNSQLWYKTVNDWVDRWTKK